MVYVFAKLFRNSLLYLSLMRETSHLPGEPHELDEVHFECVHGGQMSIHTPCLASITDCGLVALAAQSLPPSASAPFLKRGLWDHLRPSLRRYKIIWEQDWPLSILPLYHHPSFLLPSAISRLTGMADPRPRTCWCLRSSNQHALLRLHATRRAMVPIVARRPREASLS